MRHLVFVVFLILFAPTLSWSSDVLCEQRLDRISQGPKACSSKDSFSDIAQISMFQRVQGCQEEYKKNKCDELIQKLPKADQSKIATCDGKNLCRTPLDQIGSVGLGCIIGGKNFVVGAVESVIGLAQLISESSAAEEECSTGPESLNTKRLLYSLYNDSVPGLLQRKIPSDDALSRMRCAQIKNILFDAHKFTVRKLDTEYSVAVKTKRPISEDLQSFHDWQKTQLNKASGVQSDLIGSAKKVIEDMGIKLSCYNEEAATAMICEAIIAGAVTVLPGSSVFLLSKAKLLKLAGVAEDATLARGMLGLQRAATLSNNQRVVEAEKLLGRSLSESQKKALLDAHNVGAGTGRGIASDASAGGTRSTYSSTDLREKAEILKNSGFTDVERDMLMREGLAGSLGDVQVARTYANKTRLEADKLRTEGKIKEAESSYRSAADSYDAYLNDARVQKTGRDYWIGAELNTRAGRYDKGAEYFIKSNNSAGNADQKAQAIFESLRREKDELRSLAAKNSNSPGVQKAYQDHLKLIEAVVSSPSLRMGDAWKRELLKP